MKHAIAMIKRWSPHKASSVNHFRTALSLKRLVTAVFAEGKCFREIVSNLAYVSAFERALIFNARVIFLSTPCQGTAQCLSSVQEQEAFSACYTLWDQGRRPSQKHYNIYWVVKCGFHKAQLWQIPFKSAQFSQAERVEPGSFCWKLW